MKKLGQNALCAFIAAILFFSPLCIYAEGVDTENTFNVDFSNAESEFNITVTPSELMKKLYGDDGIEQSEADYLDAYYRYAFVYSPNVSAESIRIELNGDGTFTVSASSESYTAANGETVTWTPCKVSYGDVLDKEIPCTFEFTEADAVSVKYKCTVELPSEYVEDISNFAHDDAELGAQIRAKHAEALSQYLEGIKEYERYLDELTRYNNALLEYGEYTKKLEAYNESLTKYNAYLAALSSYTQAMAAYRKYLADYDEYLSAKAAYEQAYRENQAEYEKYILYIENLSKIRASTAYIESLFTLPSNGNVGCLFDALQNKELIAMIEKYDSVLVATYRVKQSDIDSMCTVSDELNELLHGYSEARAVSEEEAFAYYKKNYSSITQKFNFLYDKLTTILTPTIYNHMCAWVELEYKDDTSMASYKKWRIRNVLCHIYLICRGLDDSTTAESTWSFYAENGTPYTYNFSDLLSQNIILADTNSADPSDIEWWSGEVPAQGLPKAPTMPAEVTEPVAPMEVNKPVQPTEVKAPGEPPTEVKAPETRPAIENYDTVIRTQNYFGSDIPPSRECTGSRTVDFECTVERAVSADGTPLTVYYSYDGKTISTGESAPPSPSRPDTEEYTYTFKEWRSCTSFGDTLLYPIYTAKKREYAVRFLNSDGDVLYERQYEYGETPEYKGETPQKASTAELTYTFDGWYPPPSAIKSDTDFTAQFYESQRLYKITWNIRGDVTERYLPYGSAVTMPSVKQVEYIGGTCYTFTGWDSDGQTVTGDMQYTARFEEKILASVAIPDGNGLTVYDAGDTLVLTTAAQSTEISGLLAYAKGNGKQITLQAKDFTLKLDREAVSSLCTYGAKSFVTLVSEQGVGYSFTNILGNEVHFMGTAYMELLYSSDDFSGVFIAVNGTGTLSCIPNGKYAEFVSNAAEYYRTDRRRSLEIKATENGAVFAEGSLYRVGDEVLFSTLPNTEYTVSKITLTDSAGNVADITGQTSFIMPDSDISLCVEFVPKLYTVTFLFADESYTEQYALGATVIPPKISLSFEKDGFIYSFIGWSEPVTIVTGDMTFTAKYFSVKAEYAEPADTQPALDKVIKTQLIPAAAVLAAAVTLTAAIPITAIAVKKHKTRKKGNKK